MLDNFIIDEATRSNRDVIISTDAKNWTYEQLGDFKELKDTYISNKKEIKYTVQ